MTPAASGGIAYDPGSTARRRTAVATSSAPDPPRIGFIGLGTMGAPMAGHLAAAGYPLCVHDLDPSRAHIVRELHPAVAIADDPAAVGAMADIVITMLPDGEQVRQVALGPSGLRDTIAPGALLLDTSSAQPWLTLATARALADCGVATVDAPVSGAQWGAEQADLVFMVGGHDDDVARVRPLLDLLGRSVHHLGPLGSGHVMKCINNEITAMTLLATAEGLVLGTRAGLDPTTVNAVLNESTGGSWITRNHIGPRILSRAFDDPFKLELMLKDVRIATRLARDLGLTLPAAELCETVYEAADRHAGPGKSVSELVRWVEACTKVDIVPAVTPGRACDLDAAERQT
jgi:3-hydroxyisobutyrate dehydrogenase-like beta-hydroxyacid dehydrogenase